MVDDIEVPKNVKVKISENKSSFLTIAKGFYWIVLGLFFIFVAFGLYTKGNELMGKLFYKPDTTPQLTEAQVIQLASNLIQITNQANQQRFEALLTKFSNDQASYRNESDAKFRDALLAAKNQNDAQITALSQTIAKMGTSFKESIADVYEDTERPSRSFEHFDLERGMADGSTLPVGWFKYHPHWEGDDKGVQFHYPLKYNTRVVRTETDDGTFTNFVEAWVENDYVIGSKGIKYPLDLTSAEFEERPIKDKKWRLWNPRLGLGAGFTSTSLFPQIDFSTSSYGRTTKDMDWRFMVFGIGAAGWGDNSDTTVIGSFTPVQYNIGNLIPLVENVFLGPSIAVDSNSDVGYGAIVSIPF